MVHMAGEATWAPIAICMWITQVSSWQPQVASGPFALSGTVRSYDELCIKTYQGINYNTKSENKHIQVIENGYARRYALCKLDYIELGR